MCGNESKRWEHCGINGSGVVDKWACYFLNEFLLSLCHLYLLHTAPWLRALDWHEDKDDHLVFMDSCGWNSWGIILLGNHGEVYLTIYVVAVDVHSKVPWSGPVVWNGIVLYEDVLEMVSMLLAYILDYKIVHIKGSVMGRQSWVHMPGASVLWLYPFSFKRF